MRPAFLEPVGKTAHRTQGICSVEGNMLEGPSMDIKVQAVLVERQKFFSRVSFNAKKQLIGLDVENQSQ